MSSYDIFSSYYDELTFNADYDKRVEYIKKIISGLGHDFGRSLDLACGTGTITLMLKKEGIDIFGIDGSADMLSIASMKACDEGEYILFVNQMMQDLCLPYNIDTCICTLDAINHMCDIKDVKRTFENVYEYLNKGGIFIFDVNTIYKHQEVLGNNTFTYDVDDVFLTWNNTLLNDNEVKISLKFDDRNGFVEKEEFSEKAYDIEKLTLILESIGFEVVNIYEDLTFNPVKDTSEKATFIVRKN